MRQPETFFARKGVFFKLDVYHTDSEGNRTVCSPHELKTQFEAITRQVDGKLSPTLSAIY